MSTGNTARGCANEAAAAARGGSPGGPLDLSAPDVVRHAGPATLPPGVAAEPRGARAAAEGTVLLRRRARSAVPAPADGPRGCPARTAARAGTGGAGGTAGPR
ncbi:hypothetical protein [Streptomyces sp. NPDC058683]|uniref:hypothetical protein n=1 Tax=Streptomyces sp. NPDC058683 TaxID=3346597 RepID=UPI003658630F